VASVSQQALGHHYWYTQNDSLLQRSYEIRKGDEVSWNTVPLKHTSLKCYIKKA